MSNMMAKNLKIGNFVYFVDGFQNKNIIRVRGVENETRFCDREEKYKVRVSSIVPIRWCYNDEIEGIELTDNLLDYLEFNVDKHLSSLGKWFNFDGKVRVVHKTESVTYVLCKASRVLPLYYFGMVYNDPQVKENREEVFTICKVLYLHELQNIMDMVCGSDTNARFEGVQYTDHTMLK